MDYANYKRHLSCRKLLWHFLHLIVCLSFYLVCPYFAYKKSAFKCTHETLKIPISFCLPRPVVKLSEEDTALGILPFFKTYGMTVVMMGVLQDGGTLVTQPRFDPEQFLTAILKHKVKRKGKRSDGVVWKTPQNDRIWIVKVTQRRYKNVR